MLFERDISFVITSLHRQGVRRDAINTYLLAAV
jgi:hypothetical protein